MPDRRALVVRGGWDGHAPVPATDGFMPFLRERGFTVDVSDSLDAYADAERLRGADLILQCWTQGALTIEQCTGLAAAVRAGTGLAGWHGGIVDAFRDSTDYLHLTGGQFASHPGGMVDYEVEVVPERREHPIVAGVDRIAVRSEQYWVLTDRGPSDVLATTTIPARPGDPWTEPVVSPAVWTRQWGRGRVFVCTVGHALEDLAIPAIRSIIERGDPVGVPLNVGVVGAGTISGRYLATLARLPGVRVVAVADRIRERATAVGRAHPGVVARTPAALLRSADVDVVLNLTIPLAHAAVTLAALRAGKHVYSEKPLAITTRSGRRILELAAATGLRVGCAPDTMLGGGLQTARRVVDDGGIGTPIGAIATMLCPGHEGWHPDPDLFYARGGGPLFDMGPYYVSALVHLLGPIRRVLGAGSRQRAERTIGSGPRAGDRIAVEVDTHVSAILEHASGALSTLLMSFDVRGTELPPIEVHGTGGSISVPDPNHFAGRVRLLAGGSSLWSDVAPSAGLADGDRGCGLVDMATTMAMGKPHRASAELAYHVLDVMESVGRAARRGTAVTIRSTCERPAAVPLATSSGVAA